MHDPAADTAASEGVEQPSSLTSYTAPCRRCGQRLFLLEEDLIASLSTPPLCWQCATAMGTD